MLRVVAYPVPVESTIAHSRGELATEGGDTVAELFDDYIGFVAFGLAVLSLGWGVADALSA